jgi:hypothetical protein
MLLVFLPLGFCSTRQPPLASIATSIHHPAMQKQEQHAPRHPCTLSAGFPGPSSLLRPVLPTPSSLSQISPAVHSIKLRVRAARQRTQHRRHYNLAWVLLLLVRTTDSKIRDRLQADGVEAGRRGALGRHGCGWRGASIKRSGRMVSWVQRDSEDAPVEWLFP